MPTILHFMLSLLFLLMSLGSAAQPVSGFTGSWVINKSLSDNTDKKVEIALKASGQKIQRKLFDRRDDKYRGGPPEQELYDRISYDDDLDISMDDEVYHFIYAGEFNRPVYTDNRSRSVSLTGLDEVQDFSMAHWEGNTLLVEARPRDGGFAEETYKLINNGTQLKVTLYIRPRVFEVPIELTRIFDRPGAAPRR